MAYPQYFLDATDLRDAGTFDVLIVGTGPAGVALAEHLAEIAPHLHVGMLERGDHGLSTHLSNVVRDQALPGLGKTTDRRRAFIEKYGTFPWRGQFQQDSTDNERGGMMIHAVGGRGLVAGAHLRRFDPTDLTCWRVDGLWSISAKELARWSSLAEQRLNVAIGDCDGPGQTWVLGQLIEFNASAPAWSVGHPVLKNLQPGLGYNSSVGRLLNLLGRQDLNGDVPREGLHVYVNCAAVSLEPNQHRIETLMCKDVRDPTSEPFPIAARVYALAASPIESARLVLHSPLDVPIAGKYLAEHIYCRAELEVDPRICDLHGQGVRVVVPPIGSDAVSRFQIEIMGEAATDAPSRLRLRLTGEAAMDPRPDNAVVLSDDEAEVETGVPRAEVRMTYSVHDEARIAQMKATMIDVAERLGESLRISDIRTMGFGRSHHEAGTLRMGVEGMGDSVTDVNGKLHRYDNLYAADASVFPCVGVANPMLTITALGYRLAAHLAETHFGTSIPAALEDGSKSVVCNDNSELQRRFPARGHI